MIVLICIHTRYKIPLRFSPHLCVSAVSSSLSRVQDDQVARRVPENLLDRVAHEQRTQEAPLACAHDDEIVLLGGGFDGVDQGTAHQAVLQGTFSASSTASSQGTAAGSPGTTR